MSLVQVTETQDNLDVEVEVTKKVTVISGQNVVRGEVMMLTGMFAAGTGVAGGTNTGNGTIAGEVANDTAMAGTYTIEALTATTFKVIAPNGTSIDANATAGAAYSDQIGFTITAGGTAFVAGDTFTILVKATTGKVTSFLTGNVPYTVMQEAVDASGGDVVGMAYREAILKASEVNFGTGTDAEVRDALDLRNIQIID